MQGFNWSPDNYQKYVEATEFPMLRDYEEAEIESIKAIKNPKEKTFVDVGAGYGRVLPVLSRLAKNVIAIEIDQNMFGDLEQKVSSLSNIQIVKGDANNLAELVSDQDLTQPVLLCLQNSIGTWIGDYKTMLAQMRKIAQSHGGEAVLSSFRQEAFAEFAIPMYTSAAKLVGEPDIEKCDVAKGLFVSKTGYTSRWWTKEEREEMKQILGGHLVQEISEERYFIFHIK